MSRCSLRVSLAAVLLSGLTVFPCRAETERRVLVIGVDGLRPADLVLAQTPHIDALIADGASSMTATNGWLPTQVSNGLSAPNWATMLSGYTPAIHGIGSNGDGTHFLDDDQTNPVGGSNRPTLFGRVHDSGLGYQTAVANTWSGIGMGDNSILEFSQSAVDLHYRPNDPPPTLSRDMLVTMGAVNMLLAQPRAFVTVPDGAGGTFTEDIPSFEDADPDLLFFYVGAPDSAGHAHGFGSAPYRHAIAEIDALVGQVVQAVYDRPNADNEEWLIILTTDHGGTTGSTDHANNNDIDVRTIPLIISGRRIEDGAELENASLYDVTPTVLAWLGVDYAGAGLTGSEQLVLSGLSGDVSGDGLVGVADLDILLANWGQDVPNGLMERGDADGDGTVGQGDLDVVRAGWSDGVPPDLDIPEPGSLGLLLIGGLLTMRHR